MYIGEYKNYELYLNKGHTGWWYVTCISTNGETPLITRTFGREKKNMKTFKKLALHVARSKIDKIQSKQNIGGQEIIC